MAILTKTRIREWGNSFGIVVPKDLAIKEGIKVNDRVTVSIVKKQNLMDFFGKGTGKIADAQREKDEARKLWKMN